MKTYTFNLRFRNGEKIKRTEWGRSRYDAAEVEALAQRTARGRRPGRIEIAIDTQVTRLTPDGGIGTREHNVALDAHHLPPAGGYGKIAATLRAELGATPPLQHGHAAHGQRRVNVSPLVRPVSQRPRGPVT